MKLLIFVVSIVLMVLGASANADTDLFIFLNQSPNNGFIVYCTGVIILFNLSINEI